MLLQNVRLRDYPFVYHGISLYKKGRYTRSQEIFSKLLLDNSNSSYLYFRCGMCFYKQGFWNEAISLFLKAKEREGYNSNWDVQLESAQKSLEYNLNNVATIKQKYEENPNNIRFVQDYAVELYGNKSYWLAIHVLEEFLYCNNVNDNKIYDVLSLCYEKLTNYEKSSLFLYKIVEENRSENLEYLYRYAYSLEKLDNHDLANHFYLKLIEKSGKEVKKYGLGVIHQKNERWNDAAIAYENMIMSNNHLEIMNELYLKCAYVYGRMYCWEKSAKLYKQYLDLNKKALAHTYFKCGESFEKAGLLKESSDYYYEAILRSNIHEEYWYYRCAYVLRAQNRDLEANEVFVQGRKNAVPYGIAPKVVIKNNNQAFLAKYVEYYETLPLKNNFVLLESFLGNSFSCNPYALLKHMLSLDMFKNFRFVVILNDIESLPNDILDTRIICIQRQSDAYLRYLASCKYLINNVTFPYYFIRKEGQVYLNTWHGTPLKSLGKDVRNPLFDYANVARNFLQCTHIISQNKYTNDILLEKYGVKDMYSGMVAETGYPRVDLTLNLSKNRKKEILSLLGIDNEKPIVVYAPTWRGTSESRKFDIDKLLNDLKYLESQKYNLIFKAHHFAEEAIKKSNIDVTLVPKDIDSNELLGCADILISDYSSIVFDFLKCNKTIISYIYDFEEYRDIRGLYVQKDEFPGEICTSITDLRKIILANISGTTIVYKDYQDLYANQDDGHASQKVIDFVFKNDLTYQYKYSKKPVHLFFNGPYIPNGITKSFNNLLQNLISLDSFKEYSLAVIVNGSDIKSHRNRVDEFNRDYLIEVSYQSRVGGMPMDIEELWIREQFEDNFNFPSQTFKEKYLHMYKREARRLFGNTEFKSVINFEGFSLFWTTLLSQVASKKKIIYQHSDVLSEWKTRFPYLEGVIRVYGEYDSILAVSEMTMENNKKNLSALFSIDENKFVYANNTILPSEIKSSALVEQKKKKEFFSSSKKIISIGRLSHEKDHEKLIKAFKLSSLHDKNIKLYIIGSGPLEQHLIMLIKNLNLEESVYLLGQIPNPYPYLAEADLFVLSSNHEGQPMVLLEALVLNKPIIATDIVGNRGVLKENYGLLVENSIEGLSDGMKGFFTGKYTDLTQKKFDAVKYNEDALAQFIEVIK